MHSIFRLLLSTFCFCMLGCSTTPPILKIAEEVMETAPDSALHILQQIQPNEFHSSADHALYGLLYFQALDKSKLPLKPDTLINFSLIFFHLTKDDRQQFANG